MNRFGILVWGALAFGACDPAKPAPAASGSTSTTPSSSTATPPPEQPLDTPLDPKLDPSNPVFKEKAPAEFRVRFLTSKGEFDVKVTRSWSPNGADHFHGLVKSGFYNGTKFFRVVPGFMAQIGIHGDPRVAAKFSNWNISDDPVKGSNTRGMLTYAKSGPNTRSTQIFLNFGDNSRLDADGFPPFGVVTEGMDVVDLINAEYRERPDQGTIQKSGNLYLDTEFPRLDKIVSARILE